MQKLRSSIKELKFKFKFKFKSVKKAKDTQHQNEESKPGIYSARLIQGNVNNKYEVLKKQVTYPKGTPIKPMDPKWRYGVRSTCGRAKGGDTDWCGGCETEKFRRNFKNWTSGDPEIDKL